MSGLYDFFALFCGQPADRCFWIGGEMLPVCQRCLGVYCGLLFGAMVVPAAFRRVAVMPGRWGMVVIAAAIGTMVVMGLHFIDPGAISRFCCGYAFGAALMWLALPVAKTWLFGVATRPADGRETVRFCMLSCLIAAGLAAVLEIGAQPFHPVFSGLALSGWFCAVGALTALAIGRVVAATRGVEKAPPSRPAEP